MTEFLILFVHPDDWVWYHWIQFAAAFFLVRKVLKD